MIKEATLIGFIDEKPYEMVAGESVLSFVTRHFDKKTIPTLCDAPQLKAFGSCRVCSVEMALKEGGPTKVVAACHTPMVADAYIYHESKRVQRLRRNIIELVLTDHPLDCLTCEVNGNCELQDVAAQVGIRDVRYPKGKDHLHYEKDTSHPYMRSDLSKCINCYRCVRACDEIQGEFVLSMAGRGFDNRIIKGMDSTFGESPCVSCGACAQACPTSAISDIFEAKSIEATEKTKTICTYCGVGCNLEVKTKGNEILSVRGVSGAAVNNAHTCLKGRYAFKFYNHRDRLRTPLIRKDGALTEATWEEAYDYVADKLFAIKKLNGPDAIAGISSARCTNEENYLMQKFIRALIGTNNIDCCARVCHSPTALGMQRSFGTGAATNSVADLELAKFIVVIGANPSTGHPVTGAKIKQKIMQGIPTIVIDPMMTEVAKYATYHLQLTPGTNVALLNMMLYYIVAEDLVDWAFVKERCEGYEDFIENIMALNLDDTEAITGVSRSLVKEATVALAKTGNVMEFHGLGVTEHSQGAKTVMLIANLMMITGNIGKPGMGMNPLRGQNNVQGAADMGAQPHQGAGYFDVTLPESHAHYKLHYGVDMPKLAGLKIPQMFDAAINRDLKALWIMGEDVVQSDPNTHHVKKAMNSLELLVVQDLFLTETAKMADVVFPASSFLEKNGTFTNGERRIQRVHNAVDPLEGTKPDGQIICDIMNKMGYEQPGYDPAIQLEEIAKVVPFFAGVTWDTLGDDGKQWPVKADGTDTAIIHTDGFKRGKGKFHYFDWKESSELVAFKEKYPFILTTGRILEHYNSGTMTRRTANGELVTEDFLVIHPDDAKVKSITDGDMVRLYSARGECKMSARVTTEVKPGILYTTFHFPEIMVNYITGNACCEDTMCPEYKVVAVNVEKVSVEVVSHSETNNTIANTLK